MIPLSSYRKLITLLILCLPIAILGQAQALDIEGTVFALANNEGGQRFLVGLNEPTMTFEPVFEQFSNIRDLTCSDNGTLFFSDYLPSMDESTYPVTLWRYNVDEGSPVPLLRYETKTRAMRHLQFSPEGDLFFLTWLVGEDNTDRGLWRIPNVLSAKLGFVVPELLIPVEDFINLRFELPSPTLQGFLTDGPYAGDLLIVDSPDQAFSPGGKIWRVVAPEFRQLEVFIDSFIYENRPFQPTSLVIDRDGRLLVGDFTNNIIHIFDNMGERQGTLFDLRNVNHMAMGPNEILYVSNISFNFATRSIQGGTITLYDAVREFKLDELSYELPLADIVVCDRNFSLPIMDADGDGVPDVKDYCPDFPGNPVADGC